MSELLLALLTPEGRQQSFGRAGTGGRKDEDHDLGGGACPSSDRAGRKSSLFDDVGIEQVLKFIAANPGKRSEEIYKGMPGLAVQRIKVALAALREAGKVKTQGKSRGVTYTAA